MFESCFFKFLKQCCSCGQEVELNTSVSSDVQYYHHIDYRDIIFHIVIMISYFHISIYRHMCSCSNLAVFIGIIIILSVLNIG